MFKVIEVVKMGNTVIQLRNYTAANWTSDNPILAQGEMGLEIDTNRIKFGNGFTEWNNLSYFGTQSFKYGLYTLSANQTSNISVDNHVEFNTSAGSLGGLSTGSGQANGIITLPGDMSYKMTFIVCGSGGTGFTGFQLYDRTNSQYIGGQSFNKDNTMGMNFAIKLVSSSIDIDLRIYYHSSGLTSIRYEPTRLLIEEYGGY